MFKKKSLNIFISSLLLLIPLLSFSAFATLKIPSPTSYKYLNDYVGVINDSQANIILSMGKELEDKTQAEAVVVIIESTNNIPIEDYANKLFRTWGIGKKNKDNGLLILVSINDKSWRVEVGRGLEGVIPDALSNKVMESLAKPSFIQGNYGQGIISSYSSFCDYIATEYGTTIDKSQYISEGTDKFPTTNLAIGSEILGGILLISILLDFIFNRGRISSTILHLIFISNLGRHNPPGPGGRHTKGGGRFGGGSSNGGGSSGGW